MYTISIKDALDIVDAAQHITVHAQDRQVILDDCKKITDIMNEVIKNGLIS